MTSTRRRALARTAVLTFALAGILTVTTATAANAHDGLVESSPAADSTVSTEVTSIDLEFSEDFLDLGTATSAFAIQVEGPDGKFYNSGCVSLDGARITTAAALGESGEYTVVWQVVSSDGHPTSDSFAFTYDKPQDVTAATGVANGVTCESATPAVTPDAETKGDETAVTLIVSGIIAVLIVVGIVVFLLVRRSKRTATTTEN
ncbi:MAG: copper resistance protein CopC [Leifsonia sp.]|nr:copper resistance protein CopC [Leifsonia sp.]